MHKAFKKFFNVAEAAQQEGVETSMTTQTEATASMAADITKIAELSALLATATESLASKEDAIKELTAKFEKAQASLDSSEKAKEELAAKAAAAKAVTRKEKVVAAVGTDKAPALLTATETLEDSAFDAIVASLTVNLDAESKSKMFTETGVTPTAKVDAPTAVPFNQFIKNTKKDAK